MTVPHGHAAFEPPAGMAELIANAAMRATGAEARRWAAFAGLYRAPEWGVIAPIGPPDRFFVDAGVPYFEAHEQGTHERLRLVEVEPDVFLADNGETLDLSGPTPMWRGVRLVRVTGGPAPWQWAILGTAALLAGLWIVAAAVRTVRRVRSRPPSTQQRATPGRWRLIASAVAALTALLALGSVALIALVPGLVDSGFVGWLDLPIAARLAFHVPPALALVAVGTVVLTAVGWVNRCGRTP